MLQPWPEDDQHVVDHSAPPPGRLAVGAFDERIMTHLERHVAEERELLGEYQELQAKSESPAVRYLVGLLLEDEHRHHRVLTEMLNQFRTSVYLAEQEPRVPYMIRKRDPAAAAAVKRLRRAERQDLRTLRSLRRKLKFMRRHSLDGVLVNSLILDTHKHLRYLRTLRRLV
jgi:hypothetical protein